METHHEKAGRILKEAREALRVQDYPLALELYEWFFDHAMDDGSSGYYGVRLSYCLDEWAQLGRVFELARTKLEQRRAQSIQELERTRDARKFHDFVAICRYTDAMGLAIDTFLECRNSDRELAKDMFLFIKDDLAAAGQWEVCSAYIENADDAYVTALMKLDNSLEFSQKHPERGGGEFELHVKGAYVKNVTYLVTVLTHTHRTDEAQRICQRANKDMQERGLKEFLSVYPEDFED
ncbi:hypothetical protein [Undibacterium sp.]|jgi:hypothetical protein|uniref:hypothetical protein n=1 Tax=Undibacterium sp. TaxID=1914977 RepID=UPI002BB03FB5|nr:hypothetical protein [Undibacterium sp.]HTD03970.1 hypothetical protein [Undibacterium sp.]